MQDPPVQPVYGISGLGTFVTFTISFSCFSWTQLVLAYFCTAVKNEDHHHGLLLVVRRAARQDRLLQTLLMPRAEHLRCTSLTLSTAATVESSFA